MPFCLAKCQRISHHHAGSPRVIHLAPIALELKPYLLPTCFSPRFYRLLMSAAISHFRYQQPYTCRPPIDSFTQTPHRTTDPCLARLPRRGLTRPELLPFFKCRFFMAGPGSFPPRLGPWRSWVVLRCTVSSNRNLTSGCGRMKLRADHGPLPEMKFTKALP